MPAAPLLSDAKIASRLAALPDWRLTDGRLTRTVRTLDSKQPSSWLRASLTRPTSRITTLTLRSTGTW